MARPQALSTRTWTVLLVALSAIVAFALRLLPYNVVLGGDAVSFVENDAWYHMRLVDALIRDFPNRIWFDPYLLHPGGEAVNVGPFFDWLIAGVSLLLGAGSPSERLVDQVGALIPPVFGALTVVPVYFLGRELFSRRAGLWSAAIVGVLPGEILKRSLIGFTDHHCAEVLLSSLALMFLVLALGTTAGTRRRVLYAALSGISLGCYLLTWSGGALLVAVLVVWATLQMVIERLRGRTGTDVTWASVPALLIAGLMVLPWTRVTPSFAYQIMGIGSGVVALLILRGLAVATMDLVRGRTVYLACLLVAAAAAGLLVVWVARDAAFSVAEQVKRFSPGRTLAFAKEALPLMRSEDRRPIPLWNQFTTSLYLAMFALGVTLVRTSRRLPAPGVLFLLWTVTMVLATFGQVRFSYYLAVNVALCAGYACDLVLERLSRKTNSGVPRARRAATTVVAAAGLAAVVLGPNVGFYRSFQHIPANPNSTWVDALLWFRNNTPDPFGNPDRYYATTAPPLVGHDEASATSTYGVLSWWDYGYWLIRIGRRVPLANPRQSGVDEVAEFLLADDESRATSQANGLQARYVIVNWELQPLLNQDNQPLAGILQTMAGVIGQSLDRYLHVAYRNTAAGREAVILYEPAFYQTMMSRMYRTPEDTTPAPTATWVVTVVQREEGGRPYWELVNEVLFSDYERAQAFVEAAHAPNVRIIGKDPFVSCVPIEPLREWVRVFRSLDRSPRGGPRAVQIFERAPAGRRGTDPSPSRVPPNRSMAPAR